MVVYRDPRESGLKEPGENFVALPGKRNILFRKSLLHRACWAIKAGISLESVLAAGAALCTAAGEFVYSGASPGFRGFCADSPFLITGFDACHPTLLFVSIGGVFHHGTG